MTICRDSVTCTRCAEFGHDNKLYEKLNAVLIKTIMPLYFCSFLICAPERNELAVNVIQKLFYPEARKRVKFTPASVGISYFRLLKQQ